MSFFQRIKITALFIGASISIFSCSNISKDRPLVSVAKNVETISFETDEGTLMSIDVSPDGETLVFDLLGDIYTLPIGGGVAVPLTEGRAWDDAPRFSRDGRSVYFVSDRKGFRNIWQVDLSGAGVQQVTAYDSDIFGTPNWSQDGRHLIASLGDPETRNTEFTLREIDPQTGDVAHIEDETATPWIDWETFDRLRDQIFTFSGVKSTDGAGGFSFVSANAENGRRESRLIRFDQVAQTRHQITPTEAEFSDYKPQLSHDGQRLAYFRRYKDWRSEIRILDLASGSDQSLVDITEADEPDPSYGNLNEPRPNYAFTPDDKYLVFSGGGKIRQVALHDGSMKTIPFTVKVDREVMRRVEPSVQKISDAGVADIVRWPSLSADGKTMVFVAIGYVWLKDMDSGDIRRLTDGDDIEYMPSLSPDGQSVAYVSIQQTQNAYGPARLMIADMAGGAAREILTAQRGTKEFFLLPRWSHAGDKIALIREIPPADNPKGPVETLFGWTEVEKPRFHGVASMPSSARRANVFLYARYAEFDEDDQHLIFSYPLSRQDVSLDIVALDGTGRRTLATARGFGGIQPAPDLKHLALTDHRGQVWTVPFAPGDAAQELDATSPGANRIDAVGGYYVNWRSADQLTFGLAQKFFQYDPKTGLLDQQALKVAFEKPTSEPPIVLKGGRLITLGGENGAGRVFEQGALMFEGQRILGVGQVGEVPAPKNAILINVDGKTILPGFLDTHYHTVGGLSSSFSAFSVPGSDFEDKSAISYGVTSAWDPSGPASDGSPALVDLQVAGRTIGPRWSHSAVGGVGEPYDELTSYESALQAVMHHRALGVHTLKEYNTFTRQQRQWLATAARESGVGIVSHIDNFDRMMTRMMDGYTGGDHPYFPAPIYKDVYEILRQTGYVWTPNIIITGSSTGHRSDKGDYFLQAVVEKRSKEKNGISPRSHEMMKNFSEPSSPYEHHRVSRLSKTVAELANGGANIGVGAHNMPGSLLHREMWYMHKGGMPIAYVLRAATMTNAEKIGWQEEVGSLEKGKLADFLILDDNPLDDILNTLSIKYTIQGGVIYDADTAERVDPMDLPLCTDEIRGQDVCREVAVH